MYHFQVTVNVILICDLVFRIMLSEHISYIIEEKSQMWCADACLDDGVSCNI